MKVKKFEDGTNLTEITTKMSLQKDRNPTVCNSNQEETTETSDTQEN